MYIELSSTQLDEIYESTITEEGIIEYTVRDSFQLIERDKRIFILLMPLCDRQTKCVNSNMTYTVDEIEAIKTRFDSVKEYTIEELLNIESRDY